MATEKELDHLISEALEGISDSLRAPAEKGRPSVTPWAGVWNAYAEEVGRVTSEAKTCDLLKLQYAMKSLAKAEERLLDAGPPPLAVLLGTDKQKAFFSYIGEVNRLLAERNKAVMNSQCGCSFK